MNPVSFKIPDTHVTNKNKCYEYTQIVDNVYIFNNVTQSKNDNDIQMLYLLAMSYKNSDKNKAYELFQKCKILINEIINNDLFYDIFINLAITATELKHSSDEIESCYSKLISNFPERAEPYYYWAIYCNKIQQFQKALELLLFASQLSYDEAKIKYPQTNYRAYGKFLYDEMSVSYYWLNKYNKSKELILSIIDDPDFVSERDRIKRNLDCCNEKLNA